MNVAYVLVARSSATSLFPRRDDVGRRRSVLNVFPRTFFRVLPSLDAYFCSSRISVFKMCSFLLANKQPTTAFVIHYEVSIDSSGDGE
jgi:hypothetical protein